MKRTLPSLNEAKMYSETIFDGLDVSEMTRKEYVSRVGLFIAFINAQGFHQHSYLSFKRYLQSRTDYSLATKNKYLATARIFLRELTYRGKLPFDITHNVKQFKQSKKHKKEGITDSEIKLLGVKINYLPATPRNSRLKAMFSLLAFQGLRQIEIVRLDVKDIDLGKKIAYIQGKGEDDKDVVYLAPATCKALQEYIKILKPKGSLFSSMGNRKTDRLSTRTIKREFQVIFSELGYQKTVHGFRHFYVTELLKTIDMRDVRKFSRHRSIEMLIVYDDEVSLKEKSEKVFQVMKKFDFVS